MANTPDESKVVSLLAVPVLGSEGLLAELGAAVEDEEEALRRLRTNQELVQEAWQGCPNRLIEDGRRLVLRPCEALGKARPPLPGVSASPRIRHLGIVRSSPPPQADEDQPPVPPGPPGDEWT